MLSNEVIKQKSEELFPYQYEIVGDTNIQTDNKRQFFIHSAIWASEQYRDVVELLKEAHDHLHPSGMEIQKRSPTELRNKIKEALDNLNKLGDEK